MTAPVDEARDEYADAMNLELRQSIAARVLEAMDVDQYLIDAVRNAKLPVEKPAIDDPKEFGSVVRAGYDDRSDRVLWVRIRSGWYSETQHGFHAFFAGLHDPEVLRVGIGDPSAAEWSRLDGANADSDAYAKGVEAFRTAAHGQLQLLFAEAITGERKNAYLKAIALVEELQP